MLKVQGIVFHHIFWCSITHFVSFRLLAGVFWRVYRNCFLRALSIALREEKFSRAKKCFFKEFRILSKKSIHFRQTKSTGMPNFCSISPNEQFEEDNAEKKNIFYIYFRHWLKNAGKLPRKIWLHSLNWNLHIQGIKFYLISSCSMTRFVSFRLLAEIFWRVYRNCFLRALRVVLTKETFFRTKKCFLMIFRVRAKKVLDLRQKIWQEWNILKNKQFCKEETIFCLFQTLSEKPWEVAHKTFNCFL